ncbi:F-box only protein 8 [Linum grandiflorum]
MEASVFLSSAVVVLVSVVLLSPSLIVSFLLLSFIKKQQRVTEKNGGPTDQLPQVPDLPLDIVIDILSRLSVKTLIRFKCISKHWNQLISRSPYLIYMHLIRNQQSANNLRCTYRDRSNDDGGTRTVVLYSDDPLLVYCDHHTVVSSSGDLGVLLLRWKDHMHSWHQSESEYAIWNPATRQVKHLFRPPLEPPNAPRLRQYNDDCGVGLDLVSNVVKVVLVRNYAFLRQRQEARVYVYTLGLGGGWRKLTGDYPYHPQSGASFPTNLYRSTYFKGSIYWLTYEYDTEKLPIVIFDLGTEVFRKIDCPIYGRDDDRTNSGPYIYHDSIAVFATNISSVDVWLLSGSNEGVGELCWIKHSNIGPLPLELDVCAILTDDKIVAFSRDDENRKKDLVVFDTRKQEVKVVIPNRYVHGLFTYRETLVCME